MIGKAHENTTFVGYIPQPCGDLPWKPTISWDTAAGDTSVAGDLRIDCQYGEQIVDTSAQLRCGVGSWAGDGQLSTKDR